MTTPPKPPGAQPNRVARLHAALMTASARTPGPCAGRSAWLDDDRDVRARAARLCRELCPLLDLCRAYATSADERHGVWHGVDRTASHHDRTSTTTTHTTTEQRTHA